MTANDYNPNRVAPPELALLKTSIVEDGWTQPIVVRSDHVIVDGFHRWTVSEDPVIYGMTDGFVPVVVLPPAETHDHQRLSTIRHNRARGTHMVRAMADIMADLHLPDDELRIRLGMEQEEIDRLRQRGNMLKRGAAESFSAAWVPSKDAE